MAVVANRIRLLSSHILYFADARDCANCNRRRALCNPFHTHVSSVYAESKRRSYLLNSCASVKLSAPPVYGAPGAPPPALAGQPVAPVNRTSGSRETGSWYTCGRSLRWHVILLPSVKCTVVLYAPTRGSDQLIPSLDHACPPCCSLGMQPPGNALISI
jgi:hypothetical protein